MKLRVLKTHWFKGGFFHWNDFKLNFGHSYTSYRLGPILIRMYDE